MSEALVANLIENSPLVLSILVWWLYSKVKTVSLKGSITLTFGKEKETKDDKSNQDT